MTTPETIQLKKRFTEAELEAMKQPQREALRFVIEGEDGKAKWNVYRIRAEEGVSYCNGVCSQIFESYNGILKLRVLTRFSNTEWKEIGYLQCSKEEAFDELNYFEEAS